MATLLTQPTVHMKMSLEINEQEAAALDALAGYGTDQFLKAFYEVMGKAYLQPHEEGIRTLFEAVKREIPRALTAIDKARKASKESLFPKVIPVPRK